MVGTGSALRNDGGTLAEPCRPGPADFYSDVSVGFPHAAALFSFFFAAVNDKVSQKALSWSWIINLSFPDPKQFRPARKKKQKKLAFSPEAVLAEAPAGEATHGRSLPHPLRYFSERTWAFC